jgi:hypothetical protein
MYRLTDSSLFTPLIKRLPQQLLETMSKPVDYLHEIVLFLHLEFVALAPERRLEGRDNEEAETKVVWKEGTA